MTKTKIIVEKDSFLDIDFKNEVKIHKYHFINLYARLITNIKSEKTTFFVSNKLKNELLSLGYSKYQVFQNDSLSENLNIYLKLNKYRLKNENFTIISDDCFGAYLYTYLDICYKSPFIWMYVEKPNFYKLCTNLKEYLNMNLEFIETDKKWPVARLKDVTIHFNHYKTKENAIECFNKRKERIDFNNLFIKTTINDKDEIPLFQALSCKNKIALINKDFMQNLDNKENMVFLEDDKKFEGFWQVAQLKSYKFFDIIHWLNTGRILNI